MQEPTDSGPTAVMPDTSRPLEALAAADPAQVDDYVILGRIPGHHASDVMLARSPRDGLCVLKLSGVNEITDPQRLVREADYLAKVRSRRVARLIGTGVWNDRAYFVQEFIDGPTLADVLRDAPDHTAGTADAYRLARGLAEALGDVHAADVVHRDVKPSNIIISDSRGVMLVDFGIARADTDPRITRHGMAVGTPRYMSPEQTTGENVGEASDVFGWGLVVGEALLGRHPLIDIDQGLPAVQRCFADPALGETSLGRLVRDALQYNPGYRPSLRQILAELDRTEVLPAPNETLAIPLAERGWRDVRSLHEARDMAVPLIDDALGLLADRLVVVVGAALALALLGWLAGFLVGAVLAAPGGGA